MLQRDYLLKMNVSFAILILFAQSLGSGLCVVRLRKVVIPSYKMRGESTLLECQYALNQTLEATTTTSTIARSLWIAGNSYHRSKKHPHERFHHHHPKKTGQTHHLYERAKKFRSPRSSYSNDDEIEDSEALYAVKWYKDNEEFYRFVPKANPVKHSYRVDGIRVAVDQSDSFRVLLKYLTISSSGVYRCEVSAEAPNFSSVQGEGRMDIVYLPKDGPHIRGKADHYQVGDTLSVNCTSGKSHPASLLEWFINKDAVHPSYLIYYNDTVHKHGLITSTLGLQLVIDAGLFENGVMRIKCVASVAPTLWQGDKESLLQRRRDVLEKREAMLLVVNSSSYPTRRIYSLVVSTLILKLHQIVLSHMI